MKSRTLVASLTVWVSLLLLAALLSPSPGRASSGSNLLQNSGFEEGKTSWSSGPQDATFTITNTQVHSGSWAASLNRTDGEGGEIYIYQDVPVIGGFRYRLSGWVYNYNDSPIEDYWAALRIEWRDSLEEVAPPVDSQRVYDDEPRYQERCIPYNDGDSVQAPPAATIARIKCVAHIEGPNPETPVFFDDLSFTFQGSKVYLPLVVKNY